MTKMDRRARSAGLALGLGLVAAFLAPIAANAADIIAEWANAKAPATPPALKPATVSAADTALLVLDFSGAQDPTKGPCNAPSNPRCIATLPAMQHLLGEARAAKMMVIYSVAGPTAQPGDIATAIAPQPSDTVLTHTTADKFAGTDLAKLLSDKGIKTIIVTGTRSDGAVMDTAADGTFRGLGAIVPVDGMSAPDLYTEQYTAWYLTHAPGVSAKTILTRSDMIKFGG